MPPTPSASSCLHLWPAWDPKLRNISSVLHSQPQSTGLPLAGDTGKQINSRLRGGRDLNQARAWEPPAVLPLPPTPHGLSAVPTLPPWDQSLTGGPDHQEQGSWSQRNRKINFSFPNGKRDKGLAGTAPQHTPHKATPPLGLHCHPDGEAGFTGTGKKRIHTECRCFQTREP